MFEVAITHDDRWRIAAAPGQQFLGPESMLANTFEALKNEIESWCTRIFEELADTPRRDADALREAFEKGLEQIPDSETPFTATEAEEWKQKLDTMMDRVADIETEHSEYRADLERLREDIDRLKGAGEIMPRKAWLRALGSKVFDYLDKKADIATKTAVETWVRTMIGPGGSS